SGYAELTQTLRLVSLAHQYLSKPCDAKQLENTLSRCLNVQDLLNRPALRSLVGQIRQLPALPKTYAKLRDAMGKPNASNTAIAAIVASDTAIAARVLQVVNSAFFRLARQITKIDQAVAYLGFAAVSNLVLSAEVFTRYKNVRKIDGYDLEKIQIEALKTTAATRALAQGTRLGDDAIVVGLLHDIGHLILLELCPDKLQAAYREAIATNMPLHAMETKHIGASHAEVGAYLLALWGLPYSIVDAVAHHHEPDSVLHAEFDLLGALTIAESLLDDASRANSAFRRLIDQNYLTAVHAPFTLAEAQQRVTAVLATGDKPT
ncbi:MAG: HDOD domain-containing protein, partial [Candidatus Obscuribacterales bacterium]|nr:HDOD domain-containing protein [Steroidobacteraceae bacterium]